MYIFVLSVLKGLYPSSPQTILPIYLLHPSLLVLVLSAKCDIRAKEQDYYKMTETKILCRFNRGVYSGY